MIGRQGFLLAALIVVSTGFVPSRAPAALGDCGQPQSTGAGPKTADALATLKKAVGSASSCDGDPCVCDVNGDGNVNTSDALRVLRIAVGQMLALECDCAPAECVTLGGGAALTSWVSGLPIEPAQVQLEVKIIGMNLDSFDDLGLSFGLSTTFATDSGPAAGAVSNDSRDLAVDSDATGGPAGVPYLVYGDHPADGFLPILNKNFTSPFTFVKPVLNLPGDGCVEFDESAVSEPQGLPSSGPVENLAPFDYGFGGDHLVYDLISGAAASALLASIQGDTRNAVLTAPIVRLFPGQAVLHMVDDVEPTIQQVASDFRTGIQQVTADPFGVFTGVTLDLVPTIGDGGSVNLEFRVGTQVATFFLSTAFLVDGTPTDAEIPIHRRSRNVATVGIPDGQTLVIGGLLRKDPPSTEHGLPILGDLPLVGSLFTHKRFDADEQNLLIFVTPTILDAE